MSKFILIISSLFLVNQAFAQEQPAVQRAAPTVYVDVARPSNQIKSDFPYDIPLRSATGDTLVSDQVFVQNGKPTVLAFWLTTCGPCRMELAAYSSKFEGWKKETDFNFYAVSIDFPKNYEQFVRVVGERNWPFPAWHDLNREFHLVMPGELNGLPQTFVLDKDGKIVYHKRKYMPGDEVGLFEVLKGLQ